MQLSTTIIKSSVLILALCISGAHKALSLERQFTGQHAETVKALNSIRVRFRSHGSYMCARFVILSKRQAYADQLSLLPVNLENAIDRIDSLLKT